MISSGWLRGLTLLAQTQEAAPEQGGQGNFLQQMLPMLAIMAVLFYLIVLRPQQKEKKQREKQLSELSKGDHVVTIGGLHGKISRLGKEKKTVELEMGKNVKVVVNRTAVATITRRAKSRDGDKEAGEEELE